MSFRLPPSLRLALTLLLALAMLLQASAVVAMQAAMPASAEAAVAQDASLPPCHAEALADADQPETPGCCAEDCEGFCQWACSHALSVLAMPLLRVSVLVVAAPPEPRPALSARWHATQALRPPIA